MKLAAAEINVEALVDGVWVESDSLEGVSWHVRSREYPVYKRALREHFLKNPKATKKMLKAGASGEGGIMQELILDHLLIDWSGFEDNDGAPVGYSRELAEQFLREEKYILVAQDIELAIAEAEERLSSAREEVLGN